MRLQADLFETERQTSVLNGRDYLALERLILLHSPASNPFILDSTHNQGTMWQGCRYQPDTRMDITQLHSIDVTGDFTRLPFKDSTFDVVIFDPPHLPAAAASKTSTYPGLICYGLAGNTIGREGDNVSGMFYPFLLEARRILKPDGVVLAKIADLIHNHAYQWQQVYFVNACLPAGLTPCDMLIKIDPAAGNLKSSKWQVQNHLRKGHCYWIVARNGKSEKRQGGYRIEKPIQAIQPTQPALW